MNLNGVSLQTPIGNMILLFAALLAMPFGLDVAKADSTAAEASPAVAAEPGTAKTQERRADDQGGTGAEKSPPSLEPSKEFADFEFVSVRVGNMVLHIHKPLAEHQDEYLKQLDVFLKSLEQDAAKRREVAARYNEINKDICKTLAITPEDPLGAKIVGKLLAMCNEMDVTRLTDGLALYVLLRTEVKEYLKQGGSLPGFSYDKQTGEVCYLMHQRSIQKTMTFCLPTDPKEPLAALDPFISLFALGKLEKAFPMMLNHSLEMLITARLKPCDPHVKWFTYGMANAATIELTEKYLGERAVADFATQFDTAKSPVDKGEVLLTLWQCDDASFEKHFLEMAPPEVASQVKEKWSGLQLARQCYATLECRSIIDKHGPDVIGRIMDEAMARGPVSANSIFNATSKVMGEDIWERLQPYHAKLETGKAMEAGEVMARRYQEARSPAATAVAFACIFDMASLAPESFARLLRIATPEILPAANRAFTARVAYAMRGGEKEKLAWLKAHVTYAIVRKQLGVAVGSAPELLKLEPDNWQALTAVAVYAAIQNRQKQADELIEKALKLVPAESRHIVEFYHKSILQHKQSAM